jgi:hypothetical protein
MVKTLAAGLVPIPQPPPYPILGNALEMDPENPMQSLVDLHKKYGSWLVVRSSHMNYVIKRGSRRPLEDLLGKSGRSQRTVSKSSTVVDEY